MVKQVSVFLENAKGRLFEVSNTLAKNGININGVSLADTTDFGILRLIVNDPYETARVLKENSFVVELTEVIAMCIADKPGAMAEAFKLLNDAEVSVEYLYAVNKEKGKNAILVFRTEDYEKAISVLSGNGIKLFTEEEFYQI